VEAVRGTQHGFVSSPGSAFADWGQEGCGLKSHDSRGPLGEPKSERGGGPIGHSWTASKSIHQSFGTQAVSPEDVFVALKVDRIRQFTENLADELIRIPRAAQNSPDVLVGPRRRTGRHTTSLASQDA
jgi:hypothetical protein